MPPTASSDDIGLISRCRLQVEGDRTGFPTRILYPFARHLIMTGFVIAFWATPTMSVGHLFFAAMTTAYTLVALQLEERDLVAFHGDQYRDYQRRAGTLIPRPTRRKVT